MGCHIHLAVLAVVAGKDSVHKVVGCMIAVGLHHRQALGRDSRLVIGREPAEVDVSTAGHIRLAQATDILR